MRAIVLYSSKGGNTQKIADAISSELKCPAAKVAKSMAVPDLNNFDLILLGTGIHYDNPNEDLMAYLNSLNLENAKNFLLFITWGGAGQTNQHVLTKLKTALQSKGQKVSEDVFYCYGGWNFLRRGHPNSEDLSAAKKWARKVNQDQT